MNKPDPVHGLIEENLLRQFPIALQGDQSAGALAEVTARLLVRRPDEIDQLRIYPEINRLDEKLLDILAYDFKVDWWDANYSLEEKRRVFKSSWYVHKHMGTKAAVETALRAIYPNTDVQEWFEYEGGEPYHFRLAIDITGETSDQTRLWRAMERVNFYKSLRSHVDEIIFTIVMPPATLHVGGGAGAQMWQGVPAEPDDYDFHRTIHVGGGLGDQTQIGIPAEPDTGTFQDTLHLGGGVGGQEWMGIPVKADTPAFYDKINVGGGMGAQEKIDVPVEADESAFQNTLQFGGALGAGTELCVPAEPDTPSFHTAVHTGGAAGSHTAVSVPGDDTQPSATTILRTGGVCTIISNLSKGD